MTIKYLQVTQGSFPVGASLLAKNSQAPRSFSKHALSLTFFASKLAPTGRKRQLGDSSGIRSLPLPQHGAWPYAATSA
ncbi:hypothetical protein B4O85_16600 [Pseudomonas azotoformans]|uniref:Uncharacterized protein n=1 Tax=Pseudomonas azotoformans TaxID=47878 RepID=A0A4Q0HRX5_PSEAZ|nr:hypothetical protein B4O85_16600 [Pseudomonas azotoformans]